MIFSSWLLIKNVSNNIILPTSLTHTINKQDESFSKCYSKEAFVEFFLYCGIIVLPAYELIIYPVFHRCLGMISSHWKLTFGVFLITAEVVALMVVETVARHNYLVSNNYNSTISCISHGTLSTSVDLRWIAAPLSLYSLSASVVTIGAIEFIAAQAPYSMRGLLAVCLQCVELWW